MSILFADDFKGYGFSSGLMLNGLWGSMPASLIEDPDPNATGPVLCLSSAGFGPRRPFLQGSKTVVGVAFRLWLTGLPGGSGQLCAMRDASNGFPCMLMLDATGAILVGRNRPVNGAIPIIGQTATPVITANAWNHIEVKFTMSSPVGGAVEVRVNGVTVLSLVNVNTGANSAEQVSLESGEGQFTGACIKDFVVWDNTGGQNTNFLGTVSVVGLVPTADVFLNWTPSTGTTGFNLLDNSPPVDGTDYISAGFPAPAASIFELDNLPVNVSSVRALITQIRARKEDGGDGNIQASLISGTDTGNGADRPITTAFTYYEDVFEVDPHTAAPWTPGAVDLARFKINRTV